MRKRSGSYYHKQKVAWLFLVTQINNGFKAGVPLDVRDLKDVMLVRFEQSQKWVITTIHDLEDRGYLKYEHPNIEALKEYNLKGLITSEVLAEMMDSR